jgi:hypothetical protein
VKTFWSGFGSAISLVAIMLVMVGTGFAQGEKEGQGQAVVTILPKHEGDAAANISAQNAKLKIGGKDTNITNLVPLTGSRDGLDLVVLIDSAARNSLGNQLQELAQFIKSLPPTTRVAVAYMQFGHASFATQFTTDHAQAIGGLHLPGGTPGSSGSPYFCLSDLAKRWPEGDRATRREVLMVTDGVDDYNRRYDPDDPYVQAAMQDAIKAGLVVYSIYWTGRGRADATAYANNTGQNLLVQVTEATGGKSFWEGMGNPVSFQPYLEEFSRRLRNQYELSFVTQFSGKPSVEGFKLKLSVPGAEVNSPQQVFVARPGLAQN